MVKNSGDEKGQVRCSFCGKSQDEVHRVIAGPGVYICNECVELCQEIIDEYTGGAQLDLTDIPKPQEIVDTLDQYVIGQAAAKRALAVAVYNHYKRINSDVKADDVELNKSNIIMLGPTGCGKTMLAQTLAKILNVPFAVADATSLTEAGYVGEDVENILLKLIQAADYDVERAEKGIVYIDELKIIEGTVASVPPQGGRKHPHQEFIQIDTTNVLFICGGAFGGIEDIISKRVGKKIMGFGADVQSQQEKDIGKLLAQILPEDLLKFGLIPEMVGRVPVIVTLHQLDEQALIDILTKPKNALVRQYKKLLEMDGVELDFEQDALVDVAHKAIQRNTGARGLRAIMEDAMQDIMFELPSRDDVRKCLITKAVINKEGQPILTLKEPQRALPEAAS